LSEPTGDRTGIKAVLFDFDGVLTTRSSGSETVCASLSGICGIPYERLFGEYCKYRNDLLIGKIGYETVLPLLNRSLGCEISPGLLCEAFADAPVDEKTVALAARMKRRGLAIGLITDNPKARIDAVAGSRGWDGFFDVMAVSSEIGGRKDGREIFVAALEKLGLGAADCVFIDDNENNVAVAAAMGFEAVYFDSANRDHAALQRLLERLAVRRGRKFPGD